MHPDLLSKPVFKSASSGGISSEEKANNHKKKREIYNPDNCIRVSDTSRVPLSSCITSPNWHYGVALTQLSILACYELGGCMLRNIETSLLRSFVTIAETRSFTRSAQILFRTQSAITMQMQKLEEQLDCKLTYRAGKFIELTDEGRALLPYANEILRLNDELQSSLKPMKRREEIRIGTSDDYAVMLLPKMLDDFTLSHPNVMMTINCSNRDQNIEKLKKGEIDILLAPVMIDEQIGETLRSERLVWVGTKETEIEANQPIPLTGFPVGCVCRALMVRALNQQNRAWRFAYSSNSIISIHSAILSGRVVSAVEESTVPAGGKILDGEFGLPTLPNVKISILRNKDQLSRIQNHFYEHLKENMRFNHSLDSGSEAVG